MILNLKITIDAFKNNQIFSLPHKKSERQNSKVIFRKRAKKRDCRSVSFFCK